MLNYVDAVFKGLLSKNSVLFGHGVDSPDSLIANPHLEQKTKCVCPAENHRFVSFSSNISVMWPLTAYSQCLRYNWEIPGKGLSETFRL